MIPVKMERDQARSIQQYFFKYMEETLKTQERDALTTGTKMFQHLIRELFYQVQQLFEKKLLNKGNNIKFDFTNGQAIVLYNLLFNFPISEREVYMIQLRQLLLNILYDPIMTAIKLEEIKMKQAVETA